MKRMPFLTLFCGLLFCVGVLPFLFDRSVGLRKMLLVITVFPLMPMLFLWRMAYLNWSVRDLIRYIDPFGGDKFWQLFFRKDAPAGQ